MLSVFNVLKPILSFTESEVKISKETLKIESKIFLSFNISQIFMLESMFPMKTWTIRSVYK